MARIITVKNLKKTFHSKSRKGLFKSEKRVVEALKGVSFEVEDKEIFGLLGPNGAGKTTVIKCLTTLLVPTSGQVNINGYDLYKQDQDVRASMGCMLMGERGLYWKLSGRENLDFFGSLYHIPRTTRERRITELNDLLEMDDYLERTVETYSSGQKMTMAFAKALINKAPIIVLDEPTVTMDVHTARKIRAIVKDLNREGHTIIYTTHLMSEADELCQRVAIIDKGEIKAMGTPAELKASIPHRGVIEIEGSIPPGALKKVKEISGVFSAVIRSQSNGHTKVGIVADNPRHRMAKVIDLLVNENAQIDYISSGEVSLEDVFVHLTGRSLSEDTREVVKEVKDD
ncbi:MAG TPA: ABC transporter ATP-binding protein [Euryarchaeota archaeon]|nr:ABC transporter ATP-binding protein [Euryarchaeota archaeon]